MALQSKPPVTGSSHLLPFEKLSPLDFERLCLWLVRREGYENAEHLGEAGSEGGRDVVAWKDGQRFVFQCKRVQAFTTAHAKKEIKKLRELPADEQPVELVFVVSRAVSADARKEIRDEWGDETTCHFWAGTELDERVKCHPEIVAEFFQLPAVKRAPSLPHNLPFPSLGPLFQGREEMITLLRERLTQMPAGRATAIAGKAVHGLGGVGKTRLAVEYAWRYASQYTALLFVVAGSPSDLRRNLAALCGPIILDLPEQEATEEEIREAAVLRWLNGQSGWLLILDNVDSEDAAVAVDALVARLRGGHVLLTGRLARWSAEIYEIELDVLSEPAAAEFLLARTKKRRPTPEDNKLAVVLAHELGLLPLALEQAGAYINERRLTFALYLEEWKSKHDQVLNWFDPRVSRYPASVAAAWQTSVDRLSISARRLLERLAWLGPEPIPETLLDVPVPEASEEIDLRTAIIELASYSLITRDDGTPNFTVHRLVQDVTRRSLRNSSSTTTETLLEALRWLDAGFRGDAQDVRNWPTLIPLSPHVSAIITHTEAIGFTDHPAARLMTQLAQFLDAKSLLREAEPLMRRSLEIVEKTSGAKHPAVATCLNNLALLLADTKRLSEAELLMRRAIKIDEENFGAESTQSMMRIINLAVVLQKLNRSIEAEPLMQSALKILEMELGSQHPRVATCLNNLAQLFLDARRMSEAEALMRRALEIDEINFGPEHPRVAVRLSNLASLLQTTKRLSQAEPLVRRALEIEEKSFGPEHPAVATDLNNLALLLQKTNRLSEAEVLMRRALTIIIHLTRRTGYEHSHLQAAFGNYAALLWEMGRADEDIEATLEALFQSSE